MLPHALDKLPAWLAARTRAGRLLLALDYDGTLTGIVPRPDDADLDPETGAVLRRLTARPDTDVAIVSGRALEDIRARVGIPGVYYAGNHGLEIEGPGLQCVHAEAAAVRPVLAGCAELLRPRVEAQPGASLEDKGLTVSVHFRQVEDQSAANSLVDDVTQAVAACPGLRITMGKKVVEIRPDVSWDKGRATRFLLDSLQAGAGSMLPVLYVGDDQTDEDAFRAIADRGTGVIVAYPPPADTAATAYLRDPSEVTALLAAFADQ
jgi:trehalose 6-phosphate phosphatase